MRREAMNPEMCLRQTHTAMIDQYQQNDKCISDVSPSVPKRLSEDTAKLRPSLSASSSSSSLSFMATATPSMSSYLSPRPSTSTSSKEKNRVQRSKSSSILEVVVPLPADGTSLIRRQSFSEGRRSSLTLSNGISNLKRSGTSSSLRRRSSSISSSSESLTFEEHERKTLMEDGYLCEGTGDHMGDVSCCRTPCLSADTVSACFVSMSEDEGEEED
jgi:hypothetical protein